MKRLLACALTVLLLGGCFNKTIGGAYAITGGLMLGIGVIGSVGEDPNDPSCGESCGDDPSNLFLMLGGVALVLCGAISMATDPENFAKQKPRTVRRRRPGPDWQTPSTPPATKADKARAEAVTLQARDAAIAGDCARVRELAAVVRDLDRDYSLKIFDPNPHIARCLDPATAP